MSEASESQPLVSIIIPTYNYGHFIGEALVSIQSQTYSNWECIVVDDGSTDDTGIIAKQFAGEDNRIKYHRQENQGLAAARNTGMVNSAGVYFQFLDADDLLEPQKLERQVTFLENHPDVDIVFSDARYFRTRHPDERRFSQYKDDVPWVAQISGSGEGVLMKLLANNIMVVNAPLVRRSVIEDVGCFEGSVRGIEDWDYWVRCAQAGKYFHYEDIEGTRALVRFHPTSMSTDARLMLRSMLLLHHNVARTVTDDSIRRLNRRRIAECEGLLGVEEVAAGKLMAGIRQFCRAAVSAHVPRHKAKWLFCAVSAPFISAQKLRKIVSTSLIASAKTRANHLEVL